jgi:hypothetical protein
MVVNWATATFGTRLAHAMALPDRDPTSIGAVASACKVSFNAVKKWLDYETPKLEANSAVTIAKLLKVNLLWLLTGEGPVEIGGQAIDQAASEGGLRFKPAVQARLAKLSERDIGAAEWELIRALNMIEVQNLPETDNRGSLEQPDETGKLDLRKHGT